MKKFFIILFLLSFFIFSSFAAKKLTPEQKLARREQNWKEIIRLQSHNYITRIDNEDIFFRKLVRSPRNYTIIILFNSDRECFACRQVDHSFENIAVAYKDQLNTTEIRDTFFFRIQIEGMYNVAQKMGVQTVPAVLYVPPVKGIGFPHKPKQYLYYHLTEFDMNEGEITEFLRDNASVDIEGFSKGFNMKYLYIGLALSFLFLPFIYLLIFYGYKSSSFWFFLVLVVFYLNMAGFVGNFVHQNLWAQYNMWTGEYTYINPYLQRQFQLEGYGAALCIVGAALSLIFIIHYIPTIKGSMKRRLLFLIMILITIGCLNSWMSLYCYKNKGYPYQYFFDWFELLQWWKAIIHEYTGIMF